MQAMDRQYLETPFYGSRLDEGLAGPAGDDGMWLGSGCSDS